jgi:hypothetical protein
MKEFPALSNPETGEFHLFCSKHCRDKFPYTLDRAHHEASKARDENHSLCNNCGEPLKVTHVVARFKWHYGIQEAEVVNPGDGQGWGHVYILWVADCFSPPMFAVEADNDCEAIEEFVSNERSAHMVAIDPSDYGDYATSVSAGDTVGGKDIEDDGWLDLNGKFYAEDPGLPEPEFGPSGELYDGEAIDMLGPDQIGTVRYYGVYEDVPLPEKGILPSNFSQWAEHVTQSR